MSSTHEPLTSTAPILHKYTVTGLFNGDRPREFTLAEDAPTILVGSNGSGKSTILRSINAVGTLDLPGLLRLPLRAINLEFSSGHPLEIERIENGLIIRRKDEWHFDMERFLGLQEIAVERTKNYPYQRQSSPAQRRLKVIAEMLDADNADWVQSISEDFPVFLISDQRLTVAERTEGRFGSPRPPRPVSQPIVAVNEFARDMRHSITRTLNRYAKVSQSLDEAFYHKVIEALDEKVELDELRDLLARVNEVAAELRRVGLLADEQELAADAERLEAEAVRPVIKTFAEDTLEKYEVLRPLQLQLESFISFLDKHYQNKKVEIDQEKGFVVRLEDESILPPSRLSSGEQQMLSMAYQLLFKARPGTLVLIDEPELSLHVTWQQSLVEDLGTLGKGRSLSFLLASHSPTVIGDRPELMRSLDP